MIRLVYAVIAVGLTTGIVGIVGTGVELKPESALGEAVAGTKATVATVAGWWNRDTGDRPGDKECGGGAPPVEIDWGNGAIRAIGRGALPANADTLAQAKLMAIGAAEMDAHRILAQTLTGLRLRGERGAQRFMLEGYEVRERVDACLRGARTVAIRPLPDGNVEVEVEVRLRPQPAAPAARPAVLDGYSQVVEPHPLQVYLDPAAAYERGTDRPYTGIVLDARGSGLRASRHPRLVDEQGTVVFPDEAAAEALGDVPPVRFTRVPSDAADVTNVGDNPLFVSAVASAGPRNTDVVLRNSDLALVKQLPELPEILKQQRVLVLY